MHVEVEQEEDGRWIAEVPEFPGALAYGVSRQEANQPVSKCSCSVRLPTGWNIEKRSHRSVTSLPFRRHECVGSTQVEAGPQSVAQNRLDPKAPDWISSGAFTGRIP